MSAGALDPTFGVGGKVTTTIVGASNLIASDVVVQPDGKIVTAGTATDVSSGVTEFLLTRYNRDGSLDSTFGTHGTVLTGFSDFDSFPKIGLQPNHDIVLAGTAYDFPSFTGHMALARYKTDGSLDAGFGTGGKVLTNFGGDDAANDVALQADGKIVIVGSSTNLVTFNTDIALARFNKNGSLDRGFGENGEVLTDVGSFGSARALALRPNGTIVVGAQTLASDFTLVQYGSNGSLDTTFGTGGYVFSHFGPNGSDDLLLGIVLQPDGKVVAVGGEEEASTSNFVVARYNKDGTLDSGFGAGGHATTGFGGFDLATAVVLQPDGKIVAAGPYQGATIGYALVRYNADGTLDAGFGVGGKVATDFGGFALNFGVALDPDGKIVTAGFAFDFGTGDSTIAVARYEGHDTPAFVSASSATSAVVAAHQDSLPGKATVGEIDCASLDTLFAALPFRRHWDTMA
jgi:uncharacterized delta-60 repeat protein